MSSTTELTGLIPGVGVLLFEADSESDSPTQTPGKNPDSCDMYVAELPSERVCDRGS